MYGRERGSINGVLKKAPVKVPGEGAEARTEQIGVPFQVAVRRPVKYEDRLSILRRPGYHPQVYTPTPPQIRPPAPSIAATSALQLPQ